jgi:hypothetical protein
MSNRAAGAHVLVDGHVHFHDCYTWAAFLDAASRNFARARWVRGLTLDSPGCLMFTESAGANYYGKLLDQPGLIRSLGWSLDRGDDGRSLLLTRPSDAAILLIAGRQVVTEERLEVLALGCAHEFADGRPFADTLRRIADEGGAAVIPWGFGKWLGRRGRIVRDLIERADVPFCVGDNGGRALSLPRPPLFERAERQSIAVLGGSDPLPLRDHSSRVGGYGFIFEAWQDTTRPALAMTGRIRALTSSPPVFGELNSLTAMLRVQCALICQRRRRERVDAHADGHTHTL